MECLLKEYYQDEEIVKQTGIRVELRNWEFPFKFPLETGWHEPEPTTPMNDCLHRAIAEGFEFTANGDLDDYFVPNNSISNATQHPGALVEFLRRIRDKNPDYASLVFPRKQFNQEFPDDPLYNGTGYVRNKIMRKTMVDPVWHNPKVLAIGDRIDGFSAHSTRARNKGFREEVVNLTDASAHHYRLTDGAADKLVTFPPAQQSKVVNDRTAWVFRDALDKRLKFFLEHAAKRCDFDPSIFEKVKP